MNKKKAGKLLQRFCIGKTPEKCKRCQGIIPAHAGLT